MSVTIAKKPIIATARKIASAGDDDVLKIEIPFADDVENLRKSVEESSKVDKSDKGDINMEKTEIERMLDEKLSKIKRSEVLDAVNTKADRIKERAESIGLKVDNLETKFGEHLSKTCEGVDCIKKKVEDIAGKTEGITERITERIGDVENKLGIRMSAFDTEMMKLRDILSRVDARTDTAVCSGAKGCNSDIPKGSSYCPNCGRQISSWKNLPDWVHYGKRK